MLDVAATTGIPGAVAYGALVVSVGVLVLRALRRFPPELAGLGAGLVGYLAQSIFLFPVAGLEPVAWLLAGLLVGRAATATELVSVRPPRAATVVAAALAVVAVGAGTADVVADRTARST
ncbi:MAG: hypothetical protein ACRD1K_15450, partial [Acidimicrobiales bacterium]